MRSVVKLKRAILILAIGLGPLCSKAATEQHEHLSPLYFPLVERSFTNQARQLWSQLSARRFSSQILLTPEEQRADAYLSGLSDSLERTHRTNEVSIFAQPFLRAKPAVTNNEVFRWIQRMPKGGALHLHGSTAGRAEWVITNALRRADAYINWPSDNDPGRGGIGFGTPEQIAKKGGQYVSANQLRSELARRGKSLDDEMRFLLQMTPGPKGSTGWTRFGECFSLIGDLAAYRPVALAYLEDAMDYLHEDGVQHVELRISMGSFFEGTNTWTGTNFLAQFHGLREKLRSKHGHFGLKLILCGWRGSNPEDLKQAILEVQDAKAAFPDMIVGYDLVGQEDANGIRPTADYARFFYTLEYGTRNLNLYLHDGESNWANDTNLIAAVLLNPKRIGHAFNMFRFPAIEQHVISSNILVEVCPISNQSLGLIQDLRIHPASGYVNRGVQAVLSADDPLLFGNDGLSYDFWMAYMGWDLDLRALKMLAVNSLQHSAMSERENTLGVQEWTRQWNQWIQALNAAAAEKGGN